MGEQNATDRAPPASEQGEEPLELSERQLDVLRLVAAGRSNAEIAADMYLSITTVKSYIRVAYRKIGVTRRPEAVRWTCHHGLAPRESDLPPTTPAQNPP